MRGQVFTCVFVWMLGTHAWLQLLNGVAVRKSYDGGHTLRGCAAQNWVTEGLRRSIVSRSGGGRSCCACDRHGLHPRQPKVTDHCITLRVDQHVGWLEVAVRNGFKGA